MNFLWAALRGGFCLAQEKELALSARFFSPTSLEAANLTRPFAPEKINGVVYSRIRRTR